ncbi:MAG TPA: hypothetical protein VHZ95_22920, partial [Polyangiales bacterium]|nr:hypothetical protein [Polyangiales bacterium]
MQTERVSASFRATGVRSRSYAQLGRACLVGALLRLACVLSLHPEPAWDGKIYERAAEQLAHGEGYTQRILDPFAPARATAFFPPGFPAVLSILHRAAGGRALDRFFQIAISVALIPCAWLFGRRLGGVRAGTWAAWLIALWPGGILLSASWLTEPLFSWQLSAALLPTLYARRRKRGRALAITALLLGIAAYVRPTALAIAPFVGAAVGGSRPTHKLTAAISGSVVALVVACLPLVPWAVRNQHAVYAPVLVSTNAGYNLLLGTIGDGSYERLEPAFDCPAGASEIALDRCRRERALSRIARAPIAWFGRGA